MIIKQIEIKGFGVLKVTNDLRHRPKNYLKTNHNGLYKQVQFDGLVASNDCERFYLGYDLNANDILIRIAECY